MYASWMHIGIRRTCLCTAVSRTQIGELIKPAIEGHQLNAKLAASYKARNVFALHSTQTILRISVLRSSTPHTAAQECASCAQFAYTMNKRAEKYRCNCTHIKKEKRTHTKNQHKGTHNTYSLTLTWPISLDQSKTLVHTHLTHTDANAWIDTDKTPPPKNHRKEVTCRLSVCRHTLREFIHVHIYAAHIFAAHMYATNVHTSNMQIYTEKCISLKLVNLVIHVIERVNPVVHAGSLQFVSRRQKTSA